MGRGEALVPSALSCEGFQSGVGGPMNLTMNRRPTSPSTFPSALEGALLVAAATPTTWLGLALDTPGIWLGDLPLPWAVNSAQSCPDLPQA